MENDGILQSDFLKELMGMRPYRKVTSPPPDYNMYTTVADFEKVDPAVYIMAMVSIPITEKAFIQKIIDTIGTEYFFPTATSGVTRLKNELWRSMVYHMYEVWNKTRYNDKVDVSDINAYFENEHKHLKAKIVAYVLRHGNDAPKVEDLPFKDMGIFIPAGQNDVNGDWVGVFKKAK